MDQPNPVAEPAEDGVRLDRVIAELRQWHVFRVAAGYAVGAWLLVQVVATVGPAFDLPEWILRAVVLAAIVGFLGVMAFMLFRPRVAGKGKLRVYLSRRTRLVAGAGVLLIAALAAVWSVRSLGERQPVALAVLPFADLSPSHDKAYFAQGVAEQIQSSLASEKGIKVLGRTSAEQIERNPDPKAIRASLGITHLLEGSARTAGNSLRVNVRLVDTADGSQMWEEEYDGQLADIFSVQDKIAATVVKRLRGTLLAGPVNSATPTAIDAYEAYLAARALAREPNKDTLTRALGIAQRIIAAHPDYAPGQALYADLISLLSDGGFSYGDIPADKARRIVFAHATRAIQLAPGKAEGYAALGLALPLPEAVKAYRKALQLDPSLVYVRGRLAIALNQLKRNDEAFEQYRIAADMDPLSSAVINRYAQALAVSGKAGEAMRVIDQFAQRTGMTAEAWRFRGNTYRYLGREADHVAARRRALQLDPKLPYQHEWLALSLALLGLPDQAAQDRRSISTYLRLFTGDDRGGLKQRVAQDGARAWSANGIEVAVFSLARARDWPALIRLYDLRPADNRDLCVTSPRFTPALILALQAQGRAAEAARLATCIQAEIRSELPQTYRSCDDVPGEVELVQAEILALRRDPRALDWLAKAVDRGWMGQYYSSQLADWPEFDSLRSDPRYAALQRRIDATVARERARILAAAR